MNDKISLGTIAESGNEPRTERADAAANRVKILQTAESLFNEHGVAAVNMAEIAQVAGVGKGTLYRRFANKAELCLSLMDAQMAAFQDETLAQMREMTAAGKSSLEQLDFFLDALVHFTDTHSPLLCEVQRAGLLQEGTNTSLPHFWQHMTVSGLLQVAVDAGELSPGLDIGYLADALLAPLKADLFRFQREVRGYSPERISYGLRSLVQELGHRDGEVE